MSAEEQVTKVQSFVTVVQSRFAEEHLMSAEEQVTKVQSLASVVRSRTVEVQEWAIEPIHFKFTVEASINVITFRLDYNKNKLDYHFGLL